MKRAFPILVAALLCLAGCSQRKTAWINDSVIYDLDVPEFTVDGTWASAEQQLPRIAELGMNAVLVTPAMDAAGADNFIAQAHQQGMKVLVRAESDSMAVWTLRGADGFYCDGCLVDASAKVTYARSAAFDGCSVDAVEKLLAENESSDLLMIDQLNNAEDAATAMDVLSFTLPGTLPLVNPALCGCHSAKAGFYKEMIALRRAHKALLPDSGSFDVMEDQWVPDDVFAFTRSARKDEVMVLVNLSSDYTEVALPDAQLWADAFDGEVFDEELNCPVLSPWGWRILVRN